jgi:putative hemolysin
MTDNFSLENDGISNGPVKVRLARNASEIEAAQRLRYNVFYKEYGATPKGNLGQNGLDIDHFDELADHLVVIDTRIDHPVERIVGTYRLLRQDTALKNGGFYAKDEYNISSLEKNCDNILELGRSCTHRDYRTKPVMQLLWQAIAEYIAYHKNDLLFGCASFHGTDPDKFKAQLSYLYHNHLAPEDVRSKALPKISVDMNMMAPDEIDNRRVFKELPSLIKGYLRLGGYIGDGAVIDHQFNTIDVCIILKTGLISDRYKKHYDRKNNTTLVNTVAAAGASETIAMA